jgi:hypothetical protein
MPEALRDRALDLSNREALWLVGVLVDGMKKGSGLLTGGIFD